MLSESDPRTRTSAQREYHGFREMAAPASARRTDTYQLLRQNREQLNSAIAGLSLDKMVVPVIDEWSVKDILTHITSWEELILLDLQRIQRGRQPARYHSGNESWNPLLMHGRRSFPLDQVLAEFAEVHDALTGLLDALDDGLIAGEVTVICNVLAMHDWEHAREIRAWRDRNGI